MRAKSSFQCDLGRYPARKSLPLNDRQGGNPGSPAADLWPRTTEAISFLSPITPVLLAPTPEWSIATVQPVKRNESDATPFTFRIARGEKKMISKTTADRSKIIIEHEDHIKYWTRHFGVTKDELTRAIERVGNSAAAVRKQLSAPRLAAT